MSRLHLTVNATAHELDVPASRYLAEVLRYDLHLTGTKIGCEEAECGACTVIVNGQPVDSCIYPAFKAQGAQVLTIEGVQKEWHGADGSQRAAGGEPSALHPSPLHPLQEAFILYGATQCGFCTPGFIMQAKTLLDENPDPSEAQIKECLKDTFCRCTGYTAIIAAVKAAGAKMRTGTMPPPPVPEVIEPLAQIGKPLQRPDAVEKVTGATLYTDDYVFEGMLHGVTLRSAYPHANIRGMDTETARSLPGVHAVLTHADLPGDPRHGLVENDWPVFAGGPSSAGAYAQEKRGYPARYVGDPLALVVAESQAIAEAALALIRVDYEVLPAVIDPVAARQTDAPVLHPDRPTGNLLKHIKVRSGNIDAGFAAGRCDCRAYLSHAYDRTRFYGARMFAGRPGRL